MLISSEIDSASRIIGEEKTIEYMAKAGFDAWDFSMFCAFDYNFETGKAKLTNHPISGNNYLAFARKLKKIGLDNGIHCNQSHAPFPSSSAEICSYYERALELTAEAGGKICIIHPDNDKSAEENAEMYLKLLPFAKACDVKIAAENMYTWDVEKDMATPAACSSPESFNAHLDAVNDEYLCACLDIGHTEMRGLNTSAQEMILALGSRLLALHLHDNDLRDDSHQIPFSMKIDFHKVVAALKAIDYKGYFTLEALEYLHGYTADNVYDGIKNLAAAAKRLSDMYEAL